MIISRQFPVGIRYALCALLLACVIAAIFPLSLRLLAFISYFKAVNLRLEGASEKAAAYLERAVGLQENETLIWKELGETYALPWAPYPPGITALSNAEKSRNAFLRAASLNAQDAEAVYGMARAEGVLELMHPDRYHLQKKNPYNAYPYYEEAIRLRPNGVLYHYAFAQYLYQIGEIDAFWNVTRNLVRIYPFVYQNIKKEGFWSPFVRRVVKEGLQQAAREGIESRQAHMALSYVFSEEENWAQAVSHYRRALQYKPSQITADNFLHLGQLSIENGDIGAAEELFFKTLTMSTNREKILEVLFPVYGKKGYFEERYLFYHRVKENFRPSRRIDILLARSLIDLKRVIEANRLLENLNRKDPMAEAYYWLYRIAASNDDLNGKELSIQKAAVLDPENSHYHLLLSQVLYRRKKMEPAEEHANLAISHAPKPSSALFSHRAGIRWRRGDTHGAINDWQSAISLNPKTAPFYARVAMAFEKLERLSDAMAYYQNASERDPGNAHYREKYDELSGLSKQ